MTRAVAVVMLAATAGGGSACAYFNAFYNAERRFEDARRAEELGEDETAREAYRVAIEKAAKALRRDPEGAWADDALYLIGRAHFSLGDDRAAAAALARALEVARDSALRIGAHAYLGASRARLAGHPAALNHLDEALAGGPASPDVRAFARLWRARTQFALGRDSAAWSDLVAAAAARDAGAVAREARLEWLRRAVLADDAGRAVAAAAALLSDPAADRWADSLLVWVDRAGARWGPARARDLLAAASAAAWSTDARERLELRRARLAAEAGDLTRAIEEVRALAGRAAGRSAARARVLWARWQLERAASADDLPDVREILLPAIDDPDAERLVRALRVTTTLLARAESGDAALAWFAAAELARDELGSPGLARTLFLRYADAAPDSLWAPKALLAAMALADSPAEAERIRGRLEARYRWTVYLSAIRGTVSERAFADAERRLDASLAALADNARRRAEQRDVTVTQALVAIDSARETARMDSARAACARMLDTLSVRGERADSVRAACVRGDSLGARSLIRADTLGGVDRVPVDTTAAAPVRLRGPSR